MHVKGLRDKFFAIAIHVCGMTFAIMTEQDRTIGYINLFPWLTDFRSIYFTVVIVTEALFLLVHLLEFLQFWLRSDTDKFCDRSWCDKRFNWMILFALFGGLVVQSALFGLSFTYVDMVRDMVDDDLYEWVTEFYGLPDRVSITETINDLQRHEECCGVFDYHDYYNSAYANLTTYDGRVVPLTCFRIPEEGMKATGQKMDGSRIYEKGCFEALIDVYYGYFRIVWNYIIIAAFNATDIIRVVCNMLKENQMSKEYVLPAWQVLVFIGHAVIAVLYLVLYVNFETPYSALFEGMSEEYKTVWLIVFCIECLILALELTAFCLCNCCGDDENDDDVGDDKCCRTCDLSLFSIVIVVLFVVQFVGLAFARINMDGMRDLIKNEMPEKVTQFYGMPGHAAITNAINDLQGNEDCCGAYNYTDYMGSAFAKLPNGFRKVPATCYMKAHDWQTAGDDVDSSNIYTKGCMEVLVKLYETLFQSVALYSLTVLLYMVDIGRMCAQWNRHDHS